MIGRMFATVTWLLGSLLLHAQSRELQLDSKLRFNVSWSISGTKPVDIITFRVAARTSGWVGLGLSKDGLMDGGDFWVVWVDSNGRSYIKDMHRLPNTKNGLPILDSLNDISIINATEYNGITTAAFKRKLDTCDISGDRVIDTDTVRLIYAFGSKDPENDILTASDYHAANRGAKSVFLLQPESDMRAIPVDARTFDILIDNYTIPNDTDTTYYCEFYSLTEFNKRHQIIAVEALITPGNEDIVHHILFYACPNVPETMLINSTNAQQGGNCMSPALSEWLFLCPKVIFAWAVGGTKLIFPEQVGYSIGDGSAPVVYMMEMHYNNPMLKPGQMDFSGLRFTYTSKLRTYNMDIVAAGSVPGIFVPPSAEQFRVNGFCHGSCTQDWIPPSGITVFGYFLHAHVLGVAIQVDWYRNGTSIGILATDNNYDFYFQENQFFSEPIQLLQGDTLKVTCTMSSLDRKRPTFGGFGTSNEMCLAILLYYPKQNVDACMSIPTYLTDLNSPLYSSLSVRPEKLDGFVDMETTLNAVKWSPAMIAKAQEAVDKSMQIVDCQGFPSNYKSFNSTDFPGLLKRRSEPISPILVHSGATYKFDMKTVFMAYVFVILLLV